MRHVAVTFASGPNADAALEVMPNIFLFKDIEIHMSDRDARCGALGGYARMKLVTYIVGLLLLIIGAGGFFVLLMRGSESILVYPLAGTSVWALRSMWF
jgi:hypothetical protein